MGTNPGGSLSSSTGTRLVSCALCIIGLKNTLCDLVQVSVEEDKARAASQGFYSASRRQTPSLLLQQISQTRRLMHDGDLGFSVGLQQRSGSGSALRTHTPTPWKPGVVVHALLLPSRKDLLPRLVLHF